MLRRFWLPVLVSVFGLLFLAGTGCGIVTAPVSVPEAVAANRNMHLEGTITDAAGNALTDVTLSVQKGHTYWDAAMGQRVDYEDSSSIVSGQFSVSRRGSTRVQLIFAKPGYVPALVEFDDHGFYVAAAATTQPNGSDAQRVPETQPVYRGYFGAESPNNRNPMYMDPSWHPGKPVRVILYPAAAVAR